MTTPAQTIAMTPEQEEALLARFETGFARYISVGDGWHQLIIRLDAVLAVLDPHYQIAQIKEKFGGLRFYFDVVHPALPACCSGDDETHFEPGAMLSDEEKLMHAAYDATVADLSSRYGAMHEVVNAFEALSYHICEVCGAPGSLRTANYWLQTTCDTHAPIKPVSAPDVTWIAHESYVESTSHPRLRIYPNRGQFEICLASSEDVLARCESMDAAQRLATSLIDVLAKSKQPTAS